MQKYIKPTHSNNMIEHTTIYNKWSFIKLKYLSYKPIELLVLRIININLIKKTITVHNTYINHPDTYGYILPNNTLHISKPHDISTKSIIDNNKEVITPNKGFKVFTITLINEKRFKEKKIKILLYLNPSLYPKGLDGFTSTLGSTGLGL